MGGCGVGVEWVWSGDVEVKKQNRLQIHHIPSS
jgi:hypothetical protein